MGIGLKAQASNPHHNQTRVPPQVIMVCDVSCHHPVGMKCVNYAISKHTHLRSPYCIACCNLHIMSNTNTRICRSIFTHKVAKCRWLLYRLASHRLLGKFFVKKYVMHSQKTRNKSHRSISRNRQLKLALR